MKKIILFILLILMFLSSCSIQDSNEKLYLGLMIHVEGWRNEVNLEDSFNLHASAVENMASILEDYGAVGTFEFSPEFIEAAERWDSNIIQDLHDRGHGVGVHADAGYSLNENYDYDIFVKEIKDSRLDLEKLVDFKILHVSGICSEMDWVKAAIDAGYKFTSGSVGYCAMSMPEDLRPEKYKNCLSPGECHGPLPEDITQSLTPILASSGENWLYSNSGDLVIFNARNVLYAQYEDSLGISEVSNADLTSEDLEASYQNIEIVLNEVDSNEINLIYFGWSLGDTDLHNENLLKEWLDYVDENYIQTGQVEWKTLPEVYLEYTS